MGSFIILPTIILLDNDITVPESRKIEGRVMRIGLISAFRCRCATRNMLVQE